jgi:glutathione S-transferase
MVFSSKTPVAVKEFAASTAEPPLAYVARHLDDTERFPFLLGKDFTVADAYLFWALTVAPYGGIAIDQHASLVRYVERIRERPAVKKALAAELPLYVSEVGAVPAKAAQSQAVVR